MRAVVAEGAGRWRLADVAEPVANRREVVVEVAGCGLCGTDLHTLAGANPTVQYPVTPGHEFVGTVTTVGDDVWDLRVGDRVAVNPARSCDVCRYCLGGRANLCARKGGYGARYPGGFAERVAVEEPACVVLPNTLTWRTAVLAEPVACVLHALDRTGPVFGVDALVLGGGPIGLLAAYALAAAGARVTVSEPVAERRAIGARIGVGGQIVDPSEVDDDQRWDLVVDATGIAGVIERGSHRLARGGTLLIMGVADPDARITISPNAVNWQELNIIGSASVNHTFAAAVSFLAGAGDDLGQLVTDVVDLEDFGLAVELVQDRRALKAVVVPHGRSGW